MVDQLGHVQPGDLSRFADLQDGSEGLSEQCCAIALSLKAKD